MNYDELKSLEDILFLGHGNPEHKGKIFNIDTKTMSKGKAKDFIEKLIRKYKENGLI
jgi:hypothetical protein